MSDSSPSVGAPLPSSEQTGKLIWALLNLTAALAGIEGRARAVMKFAETLSELLAKAPRGAPSTTSTQPPVGMSVSTVEPRVDLRMVLDTLKVEALLLKADRLREFLAVAPLVRGYETLQCVSQAGTMLESPSPYLPQCLYGAKASLASDFSLHIDLPGNTIGRARAKKFVEANPSSNGQLSVASVLLPNTVLALSAEYLSDTRARLRPFGIEVSEALPGYCVRVSPKTGGQPYEWILIGEPK